MRQFLDAPECCLDPGLCSPLRKYSANADDYLEPAEVPIPVSDLPAGDAPAARNDPALRLFLQTLFERSVVTSTQVELQFAELSLLAHGRSGGPRMNLPGLSSRAVTTAFKSAVKRWRALPWVKDSVARSSDGRSRPAWTKTANPGHKTTYLHLFAKQVSCDMIVEGARPSAIAGPQSPSSYRECRGQAAICVPARERAASLEEAGGSAAGSSEGAPSPDRSNRIP